MFGCFHGVDDVGSVQAGENVSIQQSQPQDDNRQPSEENKTMYMFWNDSNTKAWTHFQKWTTQVSKFTRKKENGGLILISIPNGSNLGKDCTWTLMDSSGVFNIYVEGDWTNDNEQTACGQNDCEELNITLCRSKRHR